MGKSDMLEFIRILFELIIRFTVAALFATLICVNAVMFVDGYNSSRSKNTHCEAVIPTKLAYYSGVYYSFKSGCSLAELKVLN